MIINIIIIIIIIIINIIMGDTPCLTLPVQYGPISFMREFRRVNIHHNLLDYSPRLKNICFRPVVLDKWFPLASKPLIIMIVVIIVSIVITITVILMIAPWPTPGSRRRPTPRSRPGRTRPLAPGGLRITFHVV